MVRTYCGEALPTRLASPALWPKPFLFSFLRDTETTGDHFDELPGHYFVIEKFDRAPSACLPHALAQLFILHQPEQSFSNVVNIRTITCYTRRIENDSMTLAVSFGFADNCFRDSNFLADIG
jgi:hypothetical protein